MNKEIKETSLELSLAYRLIHLDKNLGLRPVGAGEVLQRIAEKLVMKIAKEDIPKTVGSLQLFAGQEARSEAAIHPMHSTFEANETIFIARRCRESLQFSKLESTTA